MFATTVLRKFNQQWRVTLHHASRFTSSPYTGDQKKAPSLADSISASSSSASSTSRVTRVGVMRAGGEKSERDSFSKGTYSLHLKVIFLSCIHHIASCHDKCIQCAVERCNLTQRPFATFTQKLFLTYHASFTTTTHSFLLLKVRAALVPPSLLESYRVC